MALFYPKVEAMGIDLSDRSIKIGKAKKKGTEFILESLGEKNIPPGFINDGIINEDKETELIEIIRGCLNEVKGSKITTRKAICSLPEENSFIKVIRIPKTTEEEIGEVVRWQIESNFPVKLKDVFFDWQVVSQEQKKEEKSMLVSVAVVPRTIVNSYLSIFSKLGIEPIVFEIESMSSIRGLIDGYAQKPVMIIDFGQCGTGITVFSGNTILFTSHIDISGQKLTEAIAKYLKISFDEAEDIKKSIGLVSMEEIIKKENSSRGLIKEVQKNENDKLANLKNTDFEPSEIFTSLVPILTDLTEQINNYIDYFKDFKNADIIPTGSIEKIIICGGESKLVGFSRFLSKVLHIPVELGNPLKNVIVSKKISREASVDNFLSYATLIGLMKRSDE